MIGTDRPILFLDSGVGGLTVLRSLIDLLPEEPMLYFGDTRYRAPYDGVLTILAVAMVPEIARWMRGRWERMRARRMAKLTRAS
ncbi:MAG: hypothetical protein ACK4TG_05925 [Thermaurantiacus sp.]